MWHEINTQQELDDFRDAMYGFYDSCIKEMKYVSGAYVMDDLSMHPINEKRNLSVLIQRQFEDPSVIEMEFQGLIYIKMFPPNENFTCEMLDATMILKDTCIIWSDWGDLTEEELEIYSYTIICAAKMRWHAVDQYLGKEEAYIYR